MKLLTYQPSTPTHEVADDGGHDRRRPASGSAARATALTQRDRRRRATSATRHDEQAGQRDVRVGVGDAGEDRVILEQPVEAAEVDARRRASAAAPPTQTDRPRHGVVATSTHALAPQHLRAAGHDDEEDRDARSS